MKSGISIYFLHIYIYELLISRSIKILMNSAHLVFPFKLYITVNYFVQVCRNIQKRKKKSKLLL